MWRKLLGTIGARYVVAFLNLLLIFINARVLGLEGLGLAGILLASVNLVVTFNSIFCGGMIVYFMHRYSLQTVFVPAYVWALFGSLFATALLTLGGFFPIHYYIDVFLLSLFSSLVAANSRFLLGKDEVGAFNWIFLLQGGLLCPSLLLLYFLFGIKDISAYLTGVYIAYVVALLYSLFRLYRDFASFTRNHWWHRAAWKEMFIYGLWGNVDNLAEVLTTRINYFFIQRFLGYAGVGLLDSGTKVSESVWNISRAVGYITNSQVARSQKLNEQRSITLRLLRLTFIGMTAVVLIILCVPEWIYTDYLFNQDFVGITSVIRALSPGIVAFGCHTILSQYLIASGHVKYSAGSSCVGLSTLLFAGVMLIPTYGIVGAALSSSIAFLAMFIFSFWAFCRLTHSRWRDFL